jgi:hypothetical protein
MWTLGTSENPATLAVAAGIDASRTEEEQELASEGGVDPIGTKEAVGTGVGIAAITEVATRKQRPMSKSNLNALTKVYNDKGKLQGYSSNGQMVADASGYSIDSDGQKNGPKRGIVSHSMGSAWEGLWNTGDKLFGGKSSFDSMDASTNESANTSNGNQPNNNNGSPTESTSSVKDSDSSVHKNSFNSNNIPNSSTEGHSNQGKMGKAGGLLGAIGAAWHIGQTKGFEAAASHFANEAKESYNQFRGDMQSNGFGYAATNQAIDFLAGETTRNQMAKVVQNDRAQALSIFAGGVADNFINGASFLGQVGAASLQTLGQNLSSSQSSVYGQNQTYAQNFAALNASVETSIGRSDIGGYLSGGGYDNIASSVGSFLNNMGFGNSSVSAVTASALSQPSSFGGVNMMNSSAMPPMAQQSSEGWRGGITDPTSQITGLMNIAQAGTQQLANQQTQGELNQVSNQIDIVKNYMDKLVKNPPNTTSADVERLRREMSARFVQK